MLTVVAVVEEDEGGLEFVALLLALVLVGLVMVVSPEPPSITSTP